MAGAEDDGQEGKLRDIGGWVSGAVSLREIGGWVSGHMPLPAPPAGDRDDKWNLDLQVVGGPNLKPVQDTVAGARDVGELINLEERRGGGRGGPPGGGGGSQPQAELPDHSDLRMAQKIAKRFDKRVLYCNARGEFLKHNGQRFLWNPKREIEHAVQVLREEEAHLYAGQPRVVEQLLSNRKNGAIVGELRDMTSLNVEPHELDADPLLVNTPGGTYEIASGELREHRTADLLTKSASCGPDFEKEPEHWLGFLHRAMGGDEARVLALQNIVGYLCSGSTREQRFFVVLGPAASGKSTFVRVLQAVLGDYATTVPAEVFVASKHEAHRSHLADIEGRRLIVTTEIEAGDVLAESLVKSLSGSDRIKVKRLYKDPREIQPVGKLVFVGNHRLHFRNADNSLRRRLVVLRFDHPVTDAELDLDLFDTLLAEKEAILAWCLDGAACWYKEGLCLSEAETKAADAYLRAEDVVADWMAACCAKEEGAKSGTSDLFASFDAFVKENGEHRRSIKWFAQALADRGFPRARLTGGRAGFRGLRLLLPYEQDVQARQAEEAGE